MTQVFTNKGKWGNTIHWINWETRRVYGWSPQRPQVGDHFECQMDSGRTAVFRFDTVELKSDPADMFFATVTDVGYKDELPN